ncbi:2'-5' RNA ligase family protein [Streptosporangium sp. NPDC051023]|uniref:2'-5' RNA ligase family protein n=1 Tax=Streptosporangium sp. NPDC051023 TaxID=3155410 RepID=UPI00344F30AE
MADNDTETRDHWWWRPGWRPGRSFYTWHFLMEDQAALHEFVQRVRLALDGVAVLDPIPPQWLHMTTQGIGFADEVSEADLAVISPAVAMQIADLSPIEVRLGPLVVDAEGVHLPARPDAALTEARAAIRRGIGQVWGADRVPETEEFRPHVSLAYANTSGEPLNLVRETLGQYRDVIPVTLTRVSLIDLNRDEGEYRWRTVRVLGLGN